jgi:ubiquinone/menaquinone biosynthesis C-methylase UbiE
MLRNTDANYLREQQYATSQNLDARIAIHQRFSTNKYGWMRWLFEQIDFADGARVLELGCGTGKLWQENGDRLPPHLSATLSDFSAGMLESAQRAIGAQATFDYRVIDAQDIPFDTATFDIVIANHMLYHVPDRQRALREIRRVLKPSGRFYASTIGAQHMQDLHDLLTVFDPTLPNINTFAGVDFRLDNGADQIQQVFAQVERRDYLDNLIVTQAQPLMDYILSMSRAMVPPAQQPCLLELIEQRIKRNGSIFIRKEQGVFIAH